MLYAGTMTETHTTKATDHTPGPTPFGRTVEAVLTAHPAASVLKVAAAVGADQPATTRALQRAAEAGRLTRLPGGSYCLPEHAPRTQAPALGLTTDARRESLVAWVRGQVIPPTMREIADRYGVSQEAIRRDISALTKAGLLAQDRTWMGARRNLVYVGPTDDQTGAQG